MGVKGTGDNTGMSDIPKRAQKQMDARLARKWTLVANVNYESSTTIDIQRS